MNDQPSGASMFSQLDDVRMLVVQDRASVIRDTKRNLPWLLGAFALIVVWLFLSAGVSVLGKLPYVTPGYTPVTGQAITFLGDAPGQNLDYPTALYSTAINMTTVGFGDIYPLSGAGRLLAVMNAFAGLTSFALLTAILVMALQPSSGSNAELHRLDPALIKAAVEAGFHDAAVQLSIKTASTTRFIDEARQLAVDLPIVKGGAETPDPSATKMSLLVKLAAAQEVVNTMDTTIVRAIVDNAAGHRILESRPVQKL